MLYCSSQLLTTAGEVGKLQEELEEMQPQLEAAQVCALHVSIIIMAVT